MKAKLYLIGSVIYVALAIVLGIAVPFLAPYAVLIGALVSGMYVGTKGLTPAKAAIDGMVTGVIGGVLAGAITIFAGSFIMATTGISILDRWCLSSEGSSPRTSELSHGSYLLE
jgi:hypothetical protein